ncbi:MAG: TRAP transporter permease, partial [Nitrospinota bacterium]
VFYRPWEAARGAALPLAVALVTALLAAWRVALWVEQPDAVRSILYLWPLPVLLLPALWAGREIRRHFAPHPSFRLPQSFVMGTNLVMLSLAAGAAIYLFSQYVELSDRTGAPNFADLRAGFVLICLAVEMCRRCFGATLPILSTLSIVYGMWGNLMPGPLRHGGQGWSELLGKLSTDFIGGVLGFLVVISSTFIIMFLLLGAFLQESGAARFFVNFCLGLFGRLRAGAGFAAVGSSAFMGTVSGSASGNVVTTGTFTIPLMMRTGYSPHIAAAVEASASSGGQIMPPVMGAGAFIMSELIEVPYVKIIGYAAIPAILYFLIVGINLQFAAGKLDLQRIPPEELPDWRAELRRGWIYLLPLAVLVYFLIEGYTPVFAGVWAVFVMAAVWMLQQGYFGLRALGRALWYAAIPATVAALLLVVYGVQRTLYALLPAAAALDSLVYPFEFLYHGAVFFLLATGLQALLLRLLGSRREGDASPLRLGEVATLLCNPFLYARRFRARGEAAPDVAAAVATRSWLRSVLRALAVGGRQGAEFGVTLATIELVVQVLSITGVGNKMSLLIESLAVDVCFLGEAAGGGCAWGLGIDGFLVGLLLTAVACAILGMGMPTTAAYVLLAILGGPVLISLTKPVLVGLGGPEWAQAIVAIRGERVAAHMFIFYFAILSAITPPVAIAALVGAKMAGAPYFKTAFTALKFAIVGFVVPFLFMYMPGILALTEPLEVLRVSFSTLLGFIALSAFFQGYLLAPTSLLDRLLLLLAGLSFFLVGLRGELLWGVLGVVLGSLAVAKQMGWSRARRPERRLAGGGGG